MRRLLLAMVLALPVLSGCGDTFVDPFLREGGPLSIYGTILSTGSAHPSYLRVQVVRTLPDPPTEPDDPAAQLNVDVTSDVLETGAVYRWEPRQVRLPDGTLGAVFESTFRALPGETHRIRVQRRSDGAEATVTLPIPPLPTATLHAATGTTQTITWSAENVVGGEMQYVIPGPTGPVPIRVPIEPQYGPVQTMDYARDFALVRQALTDFGDFREDIVLLRARSRPFVADAVSWPLLPPEDREAAQGAFSNVEGGRGLVTAATQGTFDFLPDRAAAEAAGFVIGY